MLHGYTFENKKTGITVFEDTALSPIAKAKTVFKFDQVEVVAFPLDNFGRGHLCLDLENFHKFSKKKLPRFFFGSF